MKWTVKPHPLFDEEFRGFPKDVQTGIAARAKLLKQFGPQLGRPNIDTLEGSKHKNMKELRLKAADGVWRVAFAFDPEQKAVLLVAGDKSGESETRFYKKLIKKADKRFDEHLKILKEK